MNDPLPQVRGATVYNGLHKSEYNSFHFCWGKNKVFLVCVAPEVSKIR